MKNYFDFTGRVAVVTGASSGLGNAFCKALAENGAKVAGFARRADKLEQLRADIEAAGGECLPVVCDLTVEQDVIDGVQKVIDHFGKIDILINVAGYIKVCPTVDLPLEEWQKVVDTSITAYFLMAREVAKNMIQNHYGRIINIASMYGCIASHHNPILAYNTTKGGVPNMTRGMAQEWAEYGITVNAIGPGMFPTEMMNVTEEAEQFLAFRAPIGRAGRIDEILGQMLLFASECNSYTTGQTIYIDGGLTSV
ncbi:SDR family NAD(P)-dependent oxidoreductase [Slackia heliotrinireducens]|uniref:3beta-hydroxycholanate 3-dehydrogenase (NAD(+)) n=1 Tax=Slackia heliotrinireducens (strain ATCC 29202 / DSM 20476 / NCTC 11029 / RHS 1) TaxID=471855 RepID=C7N4J6_SLAHD|nr:SDR family NAD(P)-dependent oxidoreductase [Slackia heliotrinireducens]ACV21831.1 dehydrogenase of unknown specificity, short-chain alcohol dehydrogenase like protein [Slackia heliotrinireducens DSM 20476]VEG99558.1 Gluconate 5-dehydrogenase [Slackia heliotrinireducens]